MSERLWILLPDCLFVCGTEILVDWLKHAFITRFNDIPADAYKDYTVLLASDLVMCKQKYAYSDHSDLVARRMGFIPLPLGVVMYRVLSQSIPLHNPGSYLVLFFGFLCLLSFRVLNGIIILGKACILIESAEKRHDRNESLSDAEKKKSSSNSNASATDKSTKAEPVKVEVATSPIRGWSLPPQASSVSVTSSSKTPAVTPEAYAPTSVSSVSTPTSTGLPARSDSLDFLGESKKGLMANSMVNLSSVGINEGPFTSEASRRYRLQQSLESIPSEDNPDYSDNFSLQQASPITLNTPTVSPVNTAPPLSEDQTERVQAVTPSRTPTPTPEKNAEHSENPSENVTEMRKFKRPPFLSCDSLRYRGSTDAGDFL